MRRVLTAATAVTALVVCGATAAYAAGGGSNQGTIGVVYNTVTVGGITFTGTCEYHITASGLTITGQASAAGTGIASTSLVCTVKHGSFSTVARNTTAGVATAVAETGRPPVPGTGICIAMSVSRTTGTPTPSGEFCV